MIGTYTKVFRMNFNAAAKKPRYISNCGGTRSGKTFALLQLLVLYHLGHKNAGLTSVVSETLPHLKRGAIRDFETILGTTLRDDKSWNASDHIYTFGNGSKIEFFSADSPAKVHGPARDRLLVNECNNVKYDVFRQLAVRTRKTIFIDYNPTSSFWANEKIETRDDCITIHSTFEDNEYLTKEQINEIKSNQSDANWWRVYGLGLVGQLEGLIFPDFELVDSLPEYADNMVEAFGQDYGFTNDPSSMIHVLIDTRKKIVYADEAYFSKGMLNSDMAGAMSQYGVRKHGVPIYGDCAEPKTIADLCAYGYNVRPCYKATRKAEQLQLMKGYALKITKKSVNLIREIRNYTWQTDKDGNSINEPIAFNDHAMDALRYGVIGTIVQPRQTTKFSLT